MRTKNDATSQIPLNSKLTTYTCVPCSPHTLAFLHFSAPDALLIVCGDHFGLIVDRAPSSTAGDVSSGGGGGGLVGLVDEAISRGDRAKAIEFMSLEASHGRVSAHQGKPFGVYFLRRPFGGKS